MYTLFPCTTLFRSPVTADRIDMIIKYPEFGFIIPGGKPLAGDSKSHSVSRSEEHTSELPVTDVYTLSLHDALPISRHCRSHRYDNQISGIRVYYTGRQAIGWR